MKTELCRGSKQKCTLHSYLNYHHIIMLELGRNVKNAVQFFSQTTMRNLMEQLQGGEM